ncbi:MAG: sensor histidine kinase [Bacteroidota bacterium]|nr:sensor histidine kinase [Bacteroidota bacterium]MDP4213024.1 sensor histidine kinase [Bacteroidota bacterium]
MPYSSTEMIIFLIMITAFVLIMVVFIVIILFFLQKKQQGYYSNLKAVKFYYDKELYKAQLEIQEQTFREISREIHDNVGQFLSLAKLGLVSLDINNRKETEDGIAEITEILEKALEDLRDMSKAMNPDVIRKGGLKKAIEMQVGFLQRGGKYHVTFNINGECQSISEEKEIILFRILQEAVNNIIRHASARDIVILLNPGEQELTLIIQDNGKGFDTRLTNSQFSRIGGINHMQQRAKLIDARFDIESTEGKGTTITVSTPL